VLHKIQSSMVRSEVHPDESWEQFYLHFSVNTVIIHCRKIEWSDTGFKINEVAGNSEVALLSHLLSQIIFESGPPAPVFDDIYE
jgi:hypothetical protein